MLKNILIFLRLTHYLAESVCEEPRVAVNEADMLTVIFDGVTDCSVSVVERSSTLEL